MLALLAFIAISSPAVDYSREIKPLLASRCGSCHGAIAQKGGLRLDTAAMVRKGGDSGPAIVPGKPKDSLLIKRVSSAEETDRMPPDGPALSPGQVDAINRWISEGGLGQAGEKEEPDPRSHWAFIPPSRPVPPANGASHPIDAFLKKSRDRLGIATAGPAEKATLLRRATLDLTGLPPTAEDVRSFLSDGNEDRFERLVNRLLESPHHGERWGRHWMDVWRYSDWYGRRSVPDNLNSYGMIWRWRDWIVRSLNEDKPYDRMVQEMLAGDELAPGDEAAAVATGFLVRNYFRWNYNQWMRDNVEHVSKAFLGLTMNCAQCHDHKYDPIPQEDYFRMRAIFEPLEIQQVRISGEADPGPYPKYSFPPGNALKPMASGMVRVFDEKPEALTRMYARGDERAIIEGKAPLGPGIPAILGPVGFKVARVTLPPEVAHPGLRPFVRDEETAKCSAAIEAARQSMQSEKDASARPWRQAELAAAKAAATSLEARLRADGARHRSGDKSAPARDAARAEKQAALATAMANRLRAEWKLAEAREAASKGDAKARSEITALEKEAGPAAVDKARRDLEQAGESYTPLSPSYPAVSSGRRLALSRAITARNNPLAARVAVNHVWKWHFGRPLVDSVENFGRGGKAPSHPELLDWLAVEFMDSGWSMKHMHRVIMGSQAYQMASNHPDGAGNQAKDRDNIHLWVYPARRLEAESIRDAVLAASGELDRALGGKEIPSDKGMTVPRRSLYFSHHPEERMVLLELFDAANPCDGYVRSSSVMPQQALAMVNSPLALRASKAVATGWAGLDDTACAQMAFNRILARDPHEDEREAAIRFLGRQEEMFRRSPPAAKPGDSLSTDPRQRAREHLALALFNHGDFVTIR